MATSRYTLPRRSTSTVGQPINVLPRSSGTIGSTLPIAPPVAPAPITAPTSGSTYPTYTDPTTADATASSDYTSGAELLDQQAGLNAQTYAQQRQDLINSFQSSLDSINLGLKGAGITSRSRYAGRNLYNANGEVSNIGQEVGAANVAPYLGQIKNLNDSNASDMSSLATSEAQSGLDIRTKKADLLNTVLGNLRTSATKTYNANVDSYNSLIKKQQDDAKAAVEAAKLPGGAIDNAKIQQGQEAKGRTYITSVKKLNEIKSTYGSDAVIKVNGKSYLKSPKERVALANAKKTLAKKSGNTAGDNSPYSSTQVMKNATGGLVFTGYDKKTKTNVPVPAAVYAANKGIRIEDALAGSTDAGDQALVSKILQLRSSGASDEEINSALKIDAPHLF